VLPGLDEDGPALIAALGQRGIDGVAVVWDAPAVDWSGFELVVVRSTWDYAERRDLFLAWARSLPRVLNPVPVLDWSTDKQRYLGELRKAGVPIVPTWFVEPGERFDPPRKPFVVKPAVSAGGRRSARFERGDTEAAGQLVDRIHSDGRTAMVQPFLGGVDETALVYLDGSYSHALRRRVPLPTAGARDVLYLDEELAEGEPTPAERAVAEAALELSPGNLLYARVDLAPAPDGSPLVLEVELAEPSLYLAFGEGAADRFAEAIRTAVDAG
jgi:glutathione synthase/RimK-type ligase-like ATP-grasp enzyme